MSDEKPKAPNNRTLTLSPEEQQHYQAGLLNLAGPASAEMLGDRILHQDLFAVLDWLPQGWVDLLFLDPPYNLTKTFNQSSFRGRSLEDYQAWLGSWLPKLLGVLKPTASVYICGDWRSAAAIQILAEKYLIVRNRITWEREKGRGAKHNWKNCSEDIWFCTAGDRYTFNAEAVRLRRRVIAPYTDDHGNPKDWQKTEDGNYRLTYPSNLWTDLTVPFWSMPENTDHPTQKPEKLLAKIILASSQPGDMVFDPFLGSGTTAVVAKKLGRRYAGVELDLLYCCLAQKRLHLAEGDRQIQGYEEGVFWERNSSDRR
ncbi:site-specific DNA-methyltransferase [Geitlerinema sp. PCC 7407]|uniref:DNA-methyltransferase n=1 Tax=Geitlerinema sp. PCC 7407 TaxID=1173025 RepID=UPI00029F837E|nr:site-specific DNA-methyltransferase [Geitlerinema sp. PCC 7407]AFY66125.1 DNA methylase N-4/N-6 domain protein [Geitlerinema sp. PCC 7407]